MVDLAPPRSRKNGHVLEDGPVQTPLASHQTGDRDPLRVGVQKPQELLADRLIRPPNEVGQCSLQALAQGQAEAQLLSKLEPRAVMRRLHVYDRAFKVEGNSPYFSQDFLLYGPVYLNSLAKKNKGILNGGLTPKRREVKPVRAFEANKLCM